ncbi:MAG TPA: hypothetical protein VNC11_02170 [Gemmatimonadaceae bacterium]|nr:hypothetical protein [Gemmatimonadaceae bacterium]
MKMRISPRLLAFLVLAPRLLQSQQKIDSPIRQGSVQIGGTAAFTHYHNIDFDNEYTTLELMPRLGYFVRRGLAVNANLQFRKQWLDNVNLVNWGIGPGLSYYFTTSKRRLFPFVSGRTLFVRGNTHVDERTSDGVTLPAYHYKTFSNSWLISGGALFMISRQVGISSELFYQHENVGADGPSSQHFDVPTEMYGVQWGLAVFIF